MSYLLHQKIPRKTFLASDAWLSFNRYLGHKTGRLRLENQDVSWIQKQSKMAGKFYLFSHSALIEPGQTACNLIKDIKKKDIPSDINYLRFVLMYTKEELGDIKKCGAFYSAKQYDLASWHAFVPLLGYKTSDEILQTFRKSTRYEIRKASKIFDVEVCVSPCNMKMKKTFWKYYADWTQKYLKTSFVSMSYFLNLLHFYEIDPEIQYYLIFVKYKGKTVGVAMFTQYENAIYYQYSASDKQLNKGGILHVAVYEAIKIAFERRLAFVSLWGVVPKGLEHKVPKSWLGFSNFKLGFRPLVVRMAGPIIVPLKLVGYMGLVRDLWADIKLNYVNKFIR